MGNKTKPKGNNSTLPTFGEDSTGTIFVAEEEANLVDEGTGTRTLLQQNEEKVQEELNDLYMKIFELQGERDSLWRIYYDSQSNVQRLRDTLEQRQAQLNDMQIRDLEWQIRNTENTMNDDFTKAQNAQSELDEANRRIHTLETGFDTGDTSNWIDEINSGEDEHEL